ncbi:2-hydroxyacid dehydrogenase [Tengunoibacter tsumagoiensis]|uniref:D-glycerate dehydrogenase n=1 Tax=Tengunoibacter tsumagoiensis TaxID=2014871 RepID=A0A402A6T3_9CHLR|nr:D-glycerate dehydrogenase [Tengunoibacter tsumagoiensis]GCE14735.1 D-glycerate dehydrogenase [Tengunoibacter tsumagoiensis]
MTVRPTILVTQRIADVAYPRLEQVGIVESATAEESIWSHAELLRRGPSHTYLLSTPVDSIDEAFLKACIAQQPALQLVANMAVGYNNIDVAAATRLGIIITNTPGVLSDTTADLAFGLLLATARRMGEAERFLRAGRFVGIRPQLLCGADVHHATLGIIGAGRIGLTMARRASGFDMKILYYNRQRLAQEQEQLYHLTYTPFQELLQQADFVSLHLPYSATSHHLIGEQQLALMKPTGILINTARGPLVDEKALVKALKQGVIAGAGLDVFEHEPAVEPDLLAMENVVLLPHVGSATQETRTRMALMACDNIIAHTQGERPPNIVNPEVLI